MEKLYCGFCGDEITNDIHRFTLKITELFPLNPPPHDKAEQDFDCCQSCFDCKILLPKKLKPKIAENELTDEEWLHELKQNVNQAKSLVMPFKDDEGNEYKGYSSIKQETYISSIEIDQNKEKYITIPLSRMESLLGKQK